MQFGQNSTPPSKYYYFDTNYREGMNDGNTSLCEIRFRTEIRFTRVTKY